MSKTIACKTCFAPIEIPESIEVENPYCYDCAKKTFGEAYLDHAKNSSEEVDL